MVHTPAEPEPGAHTVPPVDAVLKALAERIRLRMLVVLGEAGDLCSCEIEAVLELSQSNASRHLSKLSAAGLISPYKSAQWTHYLPNTSLWAHMGFIEPALESARASLEEVAGDLERLRDYQKSGYTCRTIGAFRVARGEKRR
ncbi:MAG: metalloregulator ArsR/SmtB family transcription factor [Spirochaetia bacterium]